MTSVSSAYPATASIEKIEMTSVSSVYPATASIEKTEMSQCLQFTLLLVLKRLKRRQCLQSICAATASIEIIELRSVSSINLFRYCQY